MCQLFFVASFVVNYIDEAQLSLILAQAAVEPTALHCTPVLWYWSTAGSAASAWSTFADQLFFVASFVANYIDEPSHCVPVLPYWSTAGSAASAWSTFADQLFFVASFVANYIDEPSHCVPVLPYWRAAGSAAVPCLPRRQGEASGRAISVVSASGEGLAAQSPPSLIS